MNEHAKISGPPLPFIDLGAQRRRLGDKVDNAIARVLAHGQYIMGPEVYALEAELAGFCGAKHVISCANGTDALALVLMAKGLKPGDAVLCPSFTFAATAEVVAWFGATPVFVDVHADTFNIDAAGLESGLATAKEARPQAGRRHPGRSVRSTRRLRTDRELLQEAQSLAAERRRRNRSAPAIANARSAPSERRPRPVSFPAKPLGCYGDGGAVLTDDAALADIIRSLRNHGAGSDRYDNVRIGMNGRLDTIQAAVLIEKLKIFPDEIARRDEVAKRYNAALADVAEVPRRCLAAPRPGRNTPSRSRRPSATSLLPRSSSRAFPTAIYYPKPLHRQTAYRDFPVAGNGLPVSDAIAQEVISLPMHPYLEPGVQDRIVSAVKTALR